jgi:hypothetical protein
MQTRLKSERAGNMPRATGSWIGVALLWLAGASVCPGGQVNWIGQDGLWTDPTMWNPMVVPNNGTPPSSVYSAVISQPMPSAVTIPDNLAIAITFLDVGAGNTLTLAPGSGLTISPSTSNLLLNAGTINLSSGSQLVAPGSATLGTGTIQGVGTINLAAGATLKGFDNMPLTLKNQTIVGAGQLNVAGWINGGTIRTAPQQSLTLQGAFNNSVGLLDAENGGTLTIQNNVSGSGDNISKPALQAGTGSTVILNGNLSGNVSVLGNGVIEGTGNIVGAGTLLNSPAGLINLTGGAGEFVGNLSNPAGGQITLPGITLQRGTFFNAGTLNVHALSSMPENGFQPVLHGGGRIILGTAAQPGTVTSTGSGFIINADQTIEGAGTWTALFDNEAVIDANVGGASLTIGSPFGSSLATNINSGTLRASNGGHLVVNSGVAGGGGWAADGGTITFQNGSRIATVGPITVSNGGRLEVLTTPPDQVRLAPSASNVTLDTTSSISNHGGLMLFGNFSFAMTDPKKWDWPSASRAGLIMDGGTAATPASGAAWATLELGEKDNGAAGTGYDSSFSIPALEIGPGAHVLLQDLLDNGNRGGSAGNPEALYVDRLSFDDPTGQIDLNGLHLYYRQLVTGSVGQIINAPLSVPEPATVALLALGLLVMARRGRPRDCAEPLTQ